MLSDIQGRLALICSEIGSRRSSSENCECGMCFIIACTDGGTWPEALGLEENGMTRRIGDWFGIEDGVREVSE